MKAVDCVAPMKCAVWAGSDEGGLLGAREGRTGE